MLVILFRSRLTAEAGEDYQSLGADMEARWYEYYTMEVAEIVRTSKFLRPGSPPAEQS
jgi:hypothetical protein